LLGSEEDGGPSEVEEKLQDEEKGGAGFAEVSLVPGECEASAYHGVEDRPYGAAEPVGRGVGRFVERGKIWERLTRAE
jgi:hypothetical protein